jgi:hypothetical protein
MPEPLDYAVQLQARIQLRCAKEFLLAHGQHAASLIVYGRRPMLLELLEHEGRPN